MVRLKALTGPRAGDRILTSATQLFAQFGYKGVSTREIASAAQVNEVTLFRHYPRKHDLYLAVMESGLQEVQLRGDLLARIAEAGDGRTALVRTFELISKTLMRKPEIFRLLQFSVLELSGDFDPLVRRHLGELLEVIARYLEPWISNGELRCTNGRTVVIALIAIAMGYGSVQRALLVEGIGSDAIFEVCLDLYTA